MQGRIIIIMEVYPLEMKAPLVTLKRKAEQNDPKMNDHKQLSLNLNMAKKTYIAFLP